MSASFLVRQSVIKPCFAQLFSRKRVLNSIKIVYCSSGMDAFTKDGVVKDVIDAAPPEQLKLQYGDLVITPGLVTTPTKVQKPPSVSWTSDPNSFYSLILHDPDAPSRADPKFGEWHHWLVTNIPGGDVSKGDTMSEYIGAGPPKGTGLHRYVFLVYKQSEGKKEFPGLQKLTNRSGDNRAKWKLRDFVSKYNLGAPLAGNFFQAEYDSYVDELYKQLSG